MPATYTDRLQGLTTSSAVKPPCRVATTASITASGLQTIDGVTVAEGDRVLRKDEANAVLNGIWVASSGTWYRALDFNGTLDAVGGTQLRVNEGSTNANTYWRVSGDGAVVIGTDEVEFEADLLSDAATLSFSQGTVHAVARSAQDKLRDAVGVLDFYEPTDPDLTNALERVCYNSFSGRPALGVRIPDCPDGTPAWIFTRQIIPNRQIHFMGESEMGTVLQYNIASVNATMKGAICFGTGDTCAAYDPASGSKVQGGSDWGSDSGSDWSGVSNLTISKGTGSVNYGIWTAARAILNTVDLYGCGFKATAGNLQTGAGSVTGNANICKLYAVESFYAAEHAFFFDGDNANACKLSGCNAFEPTNTGYYDASFLGNEYAGCHASATLGTGYRSIATNQANRTLFIGCYAEDVGTPWDVAAPALIIAPKGAMPIPSVGKNIMPSTGLYNVNSTWANASLRIADTEALAFTIGDASHRAAELAKEYLRLRAADGILYAIQGGGSGLEILSGVSSVGIFTLANGYVGSGPVKAGTYLKSGSVAVASLPAAATAGVGARLMVSDSNATLTAGIGAVVVGGGANVVPVVSDGTNWRIG